MKSLENLFPLLFAGVWLFLAAMLIRNRLKSAARTKWLIFVSGLFILIGSAGFFAEMMSGEGIVRLPKSYEWPAGYVDGVRKTASGLHVVPLVPEGRVQLYDSNWHFLRGWNVDALGGDFKVAPTPGGKIDILTARGEHQYSFTENGDLLSTAHLSEPYYLLTNEGQTVIVPTSPLMWIFSGPAISWGVGVLGFIGLWLAKRLTGSQAKPPISG
jgi:hypothetical protein